MGLSQPKALVFVYYFTNVVGNCIKDRSIDFILAADFDKITHLHLGSTIVTKLTIT